MTAYILPNDPETAYLVNEELPWYYYVLPIIGGFAGLLGVKSLIHVLRGGELPAN